MKKLAFNQSFLKNLIVFGSYKFSIVVVVLPNPFRGMGAWKNSTETQQLSHASRSGPEVKNGSGVKGGSNYIFLQCRGDRAS